MQQRYFEFASSRSDVVRQCIRALECRDKSKFAERSREAARAELLRLAEVFDSLDAEDDRDLVNASLQRVTTGQ